MVVRDIANFDDWLHLGGDSDEIAIFICRIYLFFSEFLWTIADLDVVGYSLVKAHFFSKV